LGELRKRGRNEKEADASGGVKPRRPRGWMDGWWAGEFSGAASSREKRGGRTKMEKEGIG
jgi:hypothetical protein